MLEIFGTVAKEERVKTVEHYILPNSFVLENLEPFPGYHGENLPTNLGPDTFFLVTTESHSAEKIFRISHEIRSFTGLRFKGSPAKLCIGIDTYHAIRIRDLDSYDPLLEIQNCYLDAGIHFQKQKVIEGSALIELKKIFTLKKINEDIYKDIDGSMHYLKINRPLTWGRFKTISRWVRNNLDDQNFDAALAVLYGNDVHDFIRIYDKNPTLDRLNLIHQKYQEGIRRIE